MIASSFVGISFVFLGVCAEFYFTLFAEIDGGPCHERPQGDRIGHATIYSELIEPKKLCVLPCGRSFYLGNFCRVKISMCCGLVILRL